MKCLLFSLLLCLITGEAFSQAKPFSYANERRRFIIYLPEAYHQKQDNVFPVVFNFHGGGMTMTEQMYYSRMNDAAEKHQFIVVYPQGIKQDWNVGFEMSYQRGTDDVGFINALLDKLLKDYRIDSNKVYATGLSRGGFFCQRLAAELPERFAAVASVGGPLPDSVAYFHQKKTPIAVMIVHGTADNIVKFNGKDSAYRSALQTYNYWKKHNDLDKFKQTSKSINLLPGDSTSVRIIETTGKAVTVALLAIDEGGHTWPGSNPFNIGFDLGKTTREIDMNEILWKFFSKHTRNKIGK